MRRLGWQVEKIDDVHAYIKKFFLLPAIIKIQRPQNLPSQEKLAQLAKKYRTKSVIIEPASQLEVKHLNFKTLSDPYIHSKTIHIDLTPPQKIIFDRFSSAKRRAVRRAQKTGVTVEISDDIETFMKLKNKTSGLFLGFLTTHGFTKHLWKTFYPDHARVILAKLHNRYVAGILLLYSHNVAYYWMAAANRTGKKSFAPSLLVWEALKFAKKKRLKLFDFEGVYDERFPRRSRDWQGFSKFKEGFGGTPVYYPQAIQLFLH